MRGKLRTDLKTQDRELAAALSELNLHRPLPEWAATEWDDADRPRFFTRWAIEGQPRGLDGLLKNMAKAPCQMVW